MPKVVWLLAIIGFTTMVGSGVVAPSLPALAIEFGITAGVASLAVSVFAAMRLVGGLATTGLLRVWTLRTLLSGGLLLQGLSALGAGLAPEVISFLVARAVGGIGSAAFTAAATGLLIATVPADVRGRAMSTFMTGISLGTVSGPAMGGTLATLSARLPLVGYGVATTLASVLAFVLLRPHRTLRAAGSAPMQDAANGSTRATARALATDKVFVAVLMCQFIAGWIFYGMRSGFIPLHLAAAAYSTAFIGLMVSLTALSQVAGSAIAGPWSDSRGRYGPLLAGIACTAISLVFIALPDRMPLVVAGFVLLGLAAGGVNSVSSALLGDSGRGTNSTALAAYMVAMDLAAVVGSLVSGVLADSVGFPAAFALAGALTLAAGAFVLRARR
ncbi:MFS transporter [Acrocarpospora macrocephala]|uniref:Putative transporter n=1 Tax=Acrocarpospora macrocephala TaxID=150177 RepID=A0A5M3WVE7_9ACTN|nr:MFS transporter [Acrocarpospora macrocephala]GES11281.1 putative transporter [Acrocarpospora macrocephala]